MSSLIFEDAIACGGRAGIIFFSTMEAKALTLRRVATRSPFVPASRLSVSCRGTRGRLQRGFPAPIRPWSTRFPRAWSQTVTYKLSFSKNISKNPNQQKDLPRQLAFSERSRKCIVARARPHFLRRRVRVSKAFTAALDHRPVPSDNVSTSRPLHPCPLPGIPKRPIANTFSPLHSARSPNEPEQSNHVHRAHLHRPDPHLSQDPRR